MKVYQEKDNRKNQLLKLKNKYFAIIYEGVIKHKTVKQIHKELFNATINKKVTDKALFAMAYKLTNKAKKMDHKQTQELLAIAILEMFNKNKVNNLAKKVINKGLRQEEDQEKTEIIRDFVIENRKNGRIFYLASSHNDCAEDHKPYQGKIYIDDKWDRSDKRIEKYVEEHNVMTIQWVMGEPAWFITRPNCRHYFVSLKTSEVLHSSVKKMKKRHKTHSDEGDRSFSTPRTEAIAEYEDRLRMLKALYAKFPTEKLKRMIEKTELLLKKWKNSI